VGARACRQDNDGYAARQAIGARRPRPSARCYALEAFPQRPKDRPGEHSRKRPIELRLRGNGDIFRPPRKIPAAPLRPRTDAPKRSAHGFCQTNHGGYAAVTPSYVLG
jgi:hypothetical protein